jgi:hypothetical protein
MESLLEKIPHAKLFVSIIEQLRSKKKLSGIKIFPKVFESKKSINYLINTNGTFKTSALLNATM